MEPTSEFRAIHSTPQLLLASGDRTVESPGSVLEAQFRCDQGYLLLTTENTPYEEALHLVLFDGSLNRLDHLEISNPMTPGILADLATVGRSDLTFSFFGGDQWTLTVHDKPFHGIFLPAGVSRPGGGWFAPRYLELQRKPL